MKKYNAFDRKRLISLIHEEFFISQMKKTEHVTEKWAKNLTKQFTKSNINRQEKTVHFSHYQRNAN